MSIFGSDSARLSLPSRHDRSSLHHRAASMLLIFDVAHFIRSAGRQVEGLVHNSLAGT
jgi:hypothetical protein